MNLIHAISQKAHLIRGAPTNLLKYDFWQDLKRTMIKYETLGLESLDLEKTAAPRNVSRAKNRKSKREKDEASPHSGLQQPVRLPLPSTGSENPPSMHSSYQPLPIAALGASVDTLKYRLSQDSHHRIIQTPPPVPRCFSVQGSVSPPGPPNASKNPQPFKSGSSTIPNLIESPLIHARVTAKDPGSAVQKSTLCLKASPPLTDPIPIQRKGWTCSPPASFGKATSQSPRPSHSTKSIDLEIAFPAARKPSPSVTDIKDNLIHLPAPTPTSTYLKNSHAIPKALPLPQRLLLVLDLNGTLLDRLRASHKYNYTPRPYLFKFLQYAFANHSILVWSSAQPHNVKGICTRLFSQDQRETLLGEWGRNKLGLTPIQYKERVQVYKRLDRIWDDQHLQSLHPEFEEGKRWGQHNTVLIDNSVLNASAQPFNHVEVPEYVRGGGKQEGGRRGVLGQVVGYLEEARIWSDVSGFVKCRPFAINKGWSWKKGWSWPAEKDNTGT